MDLIKDINGSAFYAQYAVSAERDSNGNSLTGYMSEANLGYDSNNKISGYNGSGFAGGGGGSSDAFYIYPGTTTNKEVADNSGKDMYLYHSGSNTYLKYAGKTTYSTYAIFNFKTISGTQYNFNTLVNARVNIYPNSTSACKINTTQSVTLLDTGSTVNYAYTAYMDSNGNTLSDTHDSVTALSSFVANNSGSWGGGGGDTGTSIPLRIDYQFNEQYGQTYTSYILSSDGSNFLFTARDEGYTPSDLTISGTNYQWTYNNGRWEIPYQINGQESIQWYTNVGLQYSEQNIIDSLPTNFISTAINKVVVNNNMGSITGNINLHPQNMGATYLYTGFTGSWSGEIPTSFNNTPISSYDITVGPEYYGNDYTYVIGAYSEAGGTTINSADVFPSTDNLQPGTTYRLCWNTYNGGLYWEQGGY